MTLPRHSLRGAKVLSEKASPIAVDLACANEEIAYFYASFQREIFSLNDFYDIWTELPGLNFEPHSPLLR